MKENTRGANMQIKISVRSASRKKAAVVWRTADYPDGPMTVRDFLAETVRTNAREYNERKDADELVRLFRVTRMRHRLRSSLRTWQSPAKSPTGTP